MFDRDHAQAQMGYTSEVTTQKYDHSDGEKQKAVLQKRKSVGYVLSPGVITRYGGATLSKSVLRWFLRLLVIPFAFMFSVLFGADTLQRMNEIIQWTQWVGEL